VIGRISRLEARFARLVTPYRAVGGSADRTRVCPLRDCADVVAGAAGTSRWRWGRLPCIPRSLSRHGDIIGFEGHIALAEAMP